MHQAIALFAAGKCEESLVEHASSFHLHGQRVARSAEFGALLTPSTKTKAAAVPFREFAAAQVSIRWPHQR